MSNEKVAICVGSQKSGTTSLYEAMRQHPNVCVTKKKETGFFYNDDIYCKGYNWFLENNFPAYCGDNILFEADPNYMYFNRCIKRIHECNPETMIIVMLRNPVDRAFSQYLMMKKWALENLSFQEACEAETERISLGEWQQTHFGYVDRSRYSGQIENVLNIFPREQVCFILFEEFVRAQRPILLKIQEWLKLPVINLKEKTENVASAPRSQLLTKILHQPKYKTLRKVVGKILGGNKKINYMVGERLEKFNQVPHGQLKQPKLDEQIRRDLLSNLYDDMEKVEKLTGLDVISAWR